MKNKRPRFACRRVCQVRPIQTHTHTHTPLPIDSRLTSSHLHTPREIVETVTRYEPRTFHPTNHRTINDAFINSLAAGLSIFQIGEQTTRSRKSVCAYRRNYTGKIWEQDGGIRIRIIEMCFRSTWVVFVAACCSLCYFHIYSRSFVAPLTGEGLFIEVSRKMFFERNEIHFERWYLI